MPTLLPVKTILVLNVAFSVYTVLYLATEDGLAKRLKHMATPGRHGYPGTSVPLRQHYTGVAGVDAQLTMLVALFAEAIDLARPATLIHALHFAMQFGTAGFLLALEGARAGNRGKAVAWTTTVGNIAQNLSFAITAPSYFLVHLLGRNASTSTLPCASALLVPPVFAASLPFAFIVGYIVPSAALMLPAPHVVSWDTHQVLLAAWQLFPCYIALAQMVIQPILATVFPSLRSSSASTSRPVSQASSSSKSSSHARGALRGAYIFILVLAAASHISTTSLWSIHALAPSLFARSFPSFTSAFFPKAFWPHDARRLRKHDAAPLLLQWDEIGGSAATVTWAGTLVWSAMRVTGRADMWNVVAVVALTAAATGLAGPCGAAVVLVWIRDEMIWRYENEGGEGNGGEKRQKAL